jgi:hypothetical protein
MKKIEEYMQFSAEQQQLFAKEKKTSIYLRGGLDYLMLLLVGGCGFGIGAVVMQLITQYAPKAATGGG